MEFFLKDLKEIEFNDLIGKLKELDLLIYNKYMKENILVNSGINIIHKPVDDYKLKTTEYTISHLLHKDFVNGGLSDSENSLYEKCEEVLEELKKSKNMDDLLNLFIEEGYLYGCYVNNELVTPNLYSNKKQTKLLAK